MPPKKTDEILDGIDQVLNEEWVRELLEARDRRSPEPPKKSKQP